MTDKQRETLAKMEGIQVVKARDTNVVLFYRGQGGSLREVFPNYESHDDIQRVIDGLDNDTSYAYLDALCLIVSTDEEWAKFNTQAGHDAIMVKCLKATPAQKVEAILKAVGKWEE